VSFEEIWDDDSYKETGLPRDVPLLVVVCPSDPNLVYFALEQHMFGVNVPARRVVHHGAFEPLNSPWPEPVSSRYVVPWVLPPEVAQGNFCRACLLVSSFVAAIYSEIMACCN
jgi:hypothetical protein